MILLCYHNNVICFLAMLKTKGFIEPKGSKRDFEGGVFWDWLNVHTFNCHHRKARACSLNSVQQTEGLKGCCVRYGRIGRRRNGWFVKVDNRFGYEKWLQGECIGWFH